MSNEKTKMIFSNYKVVITDEFSEPEPLITQGDKIIVSKGNIATIIGKPKAFKTFLTSAIAPLACRFFNSQEVVNCKEIFQRYFYVNGLYGDD